MKRVTLDAWDPSASVTRSVRALVVLLQLVGLGLGSGAAGARRVAAQEIPVQQYRPQQEKPDSPGATRAFHSFSQAWSGRDAGGVA